MNIIVFASALHDTQSVMAGRRKALEEYFAGKQLQMYSCTRQRNEADNDERHTQGRGDQGGCGQSCP